MALLRYFARSGTTSTWPNEAVSILPHADRTLLVAFTSMKAANVGVAALWATYADLRELLLSREDVGRLLAAGD